MPIHWIAEHAERANSIGQPIGPRLLGTFRLGRPQCILRGRASGQFCERLVRDPDTNCLRSCLQELGQGSHSQSARTRFLFKREPRQLRPFPNRSGPGARGSSPLLSEKHPRRPATALTRSFQRRPGEGGNPKNSRTSPEVRKPQAIEPGPPTVKMAPTVLFTCCIYESNLVCLGTCRINRFPTRCAVSHISHAQAAKRERWRCPLRDLKAGAPGAL